MLIKQGGIKTYIAKNAVREILFEKNFYPSSHSPLWKLEGNLAKTVTRDKDEKCPCITHFLDTSLIAVVARLQRENT